MADEIQPRRRDEREGRREEEFLAFRARDARQLEDSLEALARAAIGAAIEVHRILGPGLPENVYKNAFSHELTLRGIPHQVEAPVPVDYKGKAVGEGRVDVLIDRKLVVELKVVDRLAEIHTAQVIAYLSAMHLQLGLLMNFHVTILADGIKRVIRSTS
jgi:GxxExxY protein